MSEHPFQASHRDILDNAVLLQMQTFLQHPEIDAIWDAFHLLDCVHFHATSLCSDTAHTIHASLWTHIQSLYAEKQYTPSILWCQLALHPALSRAAPDNAAKFQRKILASHIENSDYAAALSIFHTLPDDIQNHLFTRFLLFRLAVRGWNQTLAQDCLQFFATRGRDSRDALYACVREAQTAGDKLCAVAALTAAAATWTDEVVVAANVPALLRCAIRLLNVVAEEQAAAEDVETLTSSSFAYKEMVNVFKTGALASPRCQFMRATYMDVASEFVANNVRDEHGNPVFHDAELHWFSINSYNLGVLHCTSWEPGRLVLLFKSCLVFTAALPVEQEAADATTIMLRCHFILASLCISEAQIIKSEHTPSLYADVEAHAEAFTALCSQRWNSAAPPDPDLLQKHGILCVFHSEALLFRHHYDHLPCIIKHARFCKDANVLRALGGCLLQREAPVQVKSSLLKSIVNGIFEVEQFDSTRLAQYLRCIVQALLPMVDDGPARTLLDQAIEVAAEAKQAGVNFPTIEAEWLAAAAFNHGLTRYAARHNMPGCCAWTERALAMAQHVDDDGHFAASLAERRQKLLTSPVAVDSTTPLMAAIE